MHFTTNQCKLAWSHARNGRPAETLCDCRSKGERRAIKEKRGTKENPGVLSRSHDCRPICLDINLQLFFLGQLSKGYAHPLRYFFQVSNLQVWKWGMTRGTFVSWSVPLLPFAVVESSRIIQDYADEIKRNREVEKYKQNQEFLLYSVVSRMKLNWILLTLVVLFVGGSSRMIQNYTDENSRKRGILEYKRRQELLWW